MGTNNTYNETLSRVVTNGYKDGDYNDNYNSEYDEYDGCPEWANWKEDWN